jgi:hypothetical protein
MPSCMFGPHSVRIGEIASVRQRSRPTATASASALSGRGVIASSVTARRECPPSSALPRWLIRIPTNVRSFLIIPCPVCLRSPRPAGLKGTFSSVATGPLDYPLDETSVWNVTFCAGVSVAYALKWNGTIAIPRAVCAFPTASTSAVITCKDCSFSAASAWYFV